MKLSGARVLITGAAGGLGLALARELARSGARLCLTDRDESLLGPVRGEFPDAVVLPLDVSDESSAAACAAEVARSWAGLDVLVNNAGTVSGGDLVSVSPARHRATVEANLLGPILVTRAFLPLLEKSPGFRVAFVASASGYLPLPMAASYAATKWGVRGLAVSLEEEFRIRGFGGRRVLVVCPSYISTGLFAGASAPFLTPILEVGSVARGIARALRHDARVLDMPWSVHLLKFLARVLPDSWYRAFLRVAGVATSMARWTGRGGARA